MKSEEKLEILHGLLGHARKRVDLTVENTLTNLRIRVLNFSFDTLCPLLWYCCSKYCYQKFKALD
jgi:hypothetical protein